MYANRSVSLSGRRLDCHGVPAVRRVMTGAGGLVGRRRLRRAQAGRTTTTTTRPGWAAGTNGQSVRLGNEKPVRRPLTAAGIV